MLRTLSSSKQIIAKTNGTTLEKHSLDTLNIINILIKYDNEFLKYKFNLLNLDFDNFKNDLKKATLFHDFGKASDIWQSLALDIDFEGNLPPHAPYSGFFMEFKNDDDAIPLLVASSHHSLLTDNSFSRNKYSNILFYEDYLENLAKNENHELNKFKDISYYFQRMRDYIKYTKYVRSLFPRLDSTIDIFFKLKYCLALLYLTMADGLSSYFEENETDINEEIIVEKFPSKLIFQNMII